MDKEKRLANTQRTETPQIMENLHRIAGKQDGEDKKNVEEQPSAETDKALNHHGMFGRQHELESLIIEYQNQFDRSNKLDNKVYIAITFCGFLFVFITGLFSGILKIDRPQNPGESLITAGYILTCIAVMVSYVYVLIFFMRLLKPEQIIRMDPDKLEKEQLERMEDEEACQCLIRLYRATINENLHKLKMRCDEFTKGLRFIVPTVLLAFVAYTFQLMLSII